MNGYTYEGGVWTDLGTSVFSYEFACHECTERCKSVDFLSYYLAGHE